MPMPGGGNRDGFSLIEMVIAIACAVILLTAAIPNLGRLSSEWVLWGETQSLATSLRWGRNQAIIANTSVSLIVAENGKSYYWIDSYSKEKYEMSKRILSSSVQIAGAPRRSLRFYQHGNAVPAGTFILIGQAGEYRVVVNPAGRIRIQRI